MAGVVMKYLFKRNVPDLHFGENPYFEADDSRRKKLKQPPSGLSQHDAKILKKVQRKAYRLDESISCCCCHFRVGWAAIIGLIPFMGDIIDALLAYRIINLAKSVDGGLPEAVVAQMYANVVVDFGIGLIPIVGDIADMIYKCNTRNLQILEKHLVRKSGQAVHAENPTTDLASSSAAKPGRSAGLQQQPQQVGGVHSGTLPNTKPGLHNTQPVT